MKEERNNVPVWILLSCLVSALSAKEYYAKAEPYEILNVAASVSGEVIYADSANEGKKLGTRPYIVLDDKLDKIELLSVKNKIDATKQTLMHDQEMVENYRRIIEMKENNYNRVKDLKVKSEIEKDRDYYDLVGSRNALLGVQKEIESLKIQLGDLSLRDSQLQKAVSDKHLSGAGYVLYKLLVKSSSFVNPGTPLAQLADVRKGKLTLYLNEKEVAEAQGKSIYLDGQKTAYRIDRLWKIADASKLSSYRAEIIIAPPERFSNLVRIEFR